MQVNSSTRAYAIFRALLPDAHARARDELLASGVSEKRIIGLYPYDLANLNGGLRAYMRAGKRITLKYTLKHHESIADQSWPLYFLLPHAAVVEHGNGFDSRWEANSVTARFIANYRAATFSEIDLNSLSRFTDPHDEQAFGFIAAMSVGLLYAQQLSDAPEASAYLGSLVDTYLPDLLNDQQRLA